MQEVPAWSVCLLSLLVSLLLKTAGPLFVRVPGLGFAGHPPCSIGICGFDHSCSDTRRRQWHPTPVLLPGKSMDGGAWWAAVHGIAQSRTRLSNFTFTFYLHALEREMATHSSVLAQRIAGMGSLVGCHLWGRTESDRTDAPQQQEQRI